LLNLFQISSYFNYKLSGEYKDSIANQVGYIPFDYKKHDWIKSRFNVRKKMFNVPVDKLAELVPAGSELGKITGQTALETGLPEGLPIFAGSADKSAEVLGSGVLSEEIACMSYGTTATVQCTSKKYIELQRFFPPYPSAVPGYFNTEAMVYRGFWMIDWFKNEFGDKEVEKAAELGVPAESLLDKLIADIDPGSNGLILQPYWSAGVKNPGLEAKGAIVGFGDIHTRAHIYRAILEGLAFALRHGLEKTISKTNFSIKKVRISGGGSQSDEIMQMTADIIGLPVERPHTFETSILGAAINCAVGLGWYKNYETAVSNMTRINDVFYPDRSTQKLYNNIYKEVYVKMYPQLRPLYKRIRSIFNYPEM
jgi:sugar (pentulose or hexulose) kinase